MSVQTPLPGFAAAPVTDLARPTEGLYHYPHVSGAILSRHAVLVGQAGEDLVSSILRRHGIPLLEARGMPSDRVIVCDGALVGLQIKTVTHADAGGAWRVQVRQGCNHAGLGRRAYAFDAFDVIALAVLPENVVRFVAARGECHAVRGEELPALRARPLDSLVEALAQYGLHVGPTNG